MRILMLTILAMLVAGCNQHAFMEKFSTPEVLADAKSHVAKLQSRDFASLEDAMDDRLKQELKRSTLSQMADLIPAGQPSSIELVEAKRTIGGTDTTYYTAFEYLFGDKSVVISLTILEQNGARKIVAFYVTPQPAPLAEQNAFSLIGKSFAQYAVLAGAISALLVSLIALVKCARTKVMERKWLWVLGILVGFGKISINWQTGELEVLPVAMQLLSASYQAPILGGTIISFSIPLVALLFLSRYRRGSPVYDQMEATADRS